MATVKEVVRKYMGDVSMRPVDILEKVKEDNPASKATAQAVSQILTALRRELGEEAVPLRPRGGPSSGIGAWVCDRVKRPGSNQEIAEEASAYFGKPVRSGTVAVYRSIAKQAGAGVLASNAA